MPHPKPDDHPTALAAAVSTIVEAVGQALDARHRRTCAIDGCLVLGDGPCPACWLALVGPS